LAHRYGGDIALFRRQLQGLLTRIKKGKVGPAEFEFEQGVRELRQELPKELPLPLPPVAEEADVLRIIAEPRTVVLEAWLKLETALEELGKKTNQYNALAAPDSAYLANNLAKSGVLEPWLLNLYRDLRRLRNQATHEREFSPSVESVRDYVQMAQELEAEIRKVSNAL
jgi:hypothetical protein